MPYQTHFCRLTLKYAKQPANQQKPENMNSEQTFNLRLQHIENIIYSPDSCREKVYIVGIWDWDTSMRIKKRWKSETVINYS